MKFNKLLSVYAIIFCLIISTFLFYGCPPPNVNPDYVVRDICMDTGLLANEYCREAGTVQQIRFKKGTEPTAYCTKHEAPETIIKEICTETDLLANDYCRIAGTTKMVTFVTGTEPIAFCNVHKKPETVKIEVCDITGKKPAPYCLYTHEQEFPVDQVPGICSIHQKPDYPQKINDMIAQFLGLFNWYKIVAWNPADQKQADEWLLETLIECRKHRFAMTDSFLWLASGRVEHSHLNHKTPMLFVNNKFDHSKKNPRFFELFERFLEIHKLVGIRHCTQLFMRPSYCEWPYYVGMNVNGLRRFYSDDSIPFQKLLVTWIMEAYRKVYDPNYKPVVKIINEPTHSSGESYHKVMYFHEQIYKEVLADYLPLENLHIDLHLSEAGIGELREVHGCPKLSSCDRGGIHGNDIYGRRAIGEKHAFSTKTDFVNLLAQDKNFFGSRSKTRYFTEDAGGAAKDGLGEVWGDYVFGNAQQQYEMGLFMWQTAKRKGKRVLFGSFPVEALQGGYLPDYRASVIHWVRFQMLALAHDEVYK